MACHRFVDETRAASSDLDGQHWPFLIYIWRESDVCIGHHAHLGHDAGPGHSRRATFTRVFSDRSVDRCPIHSHSVSTFPPVRTVLVCEALRDEIGRKQTLLGFYGLTPDVEILVGDSHLPLGQLAFLIAADAPSTSTTYRVKIEVLGPQGEGQKIVVAENLFPVEAGKRIHLGFNTVGFPLVGDGTYRLILTVDGIKQPEQTFTIKQGRAE